MAEQTQPTTDRRTVLRNTAIGVAVAGVGVTAAACSSSNTTAQGSTAPTAAAAGSTSSGPVTLTTTSNVQVGGGYIDTTYEVVVTQPTAGDYKAFTAICTHQGCTVGSVANNVITCPCHGSEYSAKDGSVIQGPAPKALAPRTITVSGSDITYDA